MSSPEQNYFFRFAMRYPVVQYALYRPKFIGLWKNALKNFLLCPWSILSYLFPKRKHTKSAKIYCSPQSKVSIFLRLVQNACRNWAIAPRVTQRKSSMPKNLKKVQIYPNQVITLLEVNSLTLHNLHYIVLALCKSSQTSPNKKENRNFGAVMRLFVSYLFVWSLQKVFAITCNNMPHIFFKTKHFCLSTKR